VAGPSLVRHLVDKNFSVFLDLKFHDIPNTVAGAVAAAADLGVWMINVHACGGSKMMRAASDVLQSFGRQRPLLTAVTVLTSMDGQDLKEIGVQHTPAEQVRLLATLAAESGMDGVVCSAQEAPVLRKERGERFILVTPGIRPQGSCAGDQQRIVTPRQAVENGANYLVVGRPITEASDPLQVLQQITEEISYK
jgi:orotidine-5'-phosphate decarboxylase